MSITVSVLQLGMQFQCLSKATQCHNGLLSIGEFDRGVVTPNQLRWRPFAIPSDSVDFVRGLTTICGAGSAGKKDGFAIHVYTASISMHNSCLANADGDMLIVPQQGLPIIEHHLSLVTS